MPCFTSPLLKNLQYLDLSDNLLTDMTLTETLCDGDSPLKDLRVLNISGNALKVPAQDATERLPVLLRPLSSCCPVFVHHKSAGGQVAQADPPGCEQERVQLHAPPLLLAPEPALPQHVQNQNPVHQPLPACGPGGTGSAPLGVLASWTLSSRLPCVQVLDLSNNDLRDFVLVLPALTELHLSGNKFLRLPPGWFLPNLNTLTIQVSPALPWCCSFSLPTLRLPHSPTA